MLIKHNEICLPNNNAIFAVRSKFAPEVCYQNVIYSFLSVT